MNRRPEYFFMLLLCISLVTLAQAQEGPPPPENRSSFKGNLFNLLQQQPIGYEAQIASAPLFKIESSSAVLIQLREGVKSHFHAHHDEIVYVIQGKGVMQVGSEKQVIKAGDLILLEKGKVHNVVNKTAEPLVAISIMSPPFDGQDRVFVE